MSSGSPPAYLLWAVLACTFQAFMTLHLWSYDRFQCLKWSSGRQPGAFKRVMTYSYVATVPLLVVFSVAVTILKYREGYMTILDTVLPRPLSVWHHDHLRWVLPLYFILSFAWAFELVTHLEELTFWLFLLHQGPSKRNWFHSWEFRVWYLGSMVAILGMPLATLVQRNNLDSCVAWIFLGGSSAGSLTTLCFVYVLARFPAFIRHVKLEGAEPDVVIRLATFYHLNIIRVIFRFLFNIPLLVVGADGIAPPYPVLSHPFWPDFLIMIGGIGCFVSSAITLLIFFPRSITRESGYMSKNISPPPPPAAPLFTMPSGSLPRYQFQDPSSLKSDDAYPQIYNFPNDTQHSLYCPHLPPHHHHRHFSEDVDVTSPDSDIDHEPDTSEYHRGEERSDVTWDLRPGTSQSSKARMQPMASTSLEEEASTSAPGQAVHPYIMTFTSPIDLLDPEADEYLARPI
ncbi:hypothetical protein DFS33DRAFT_1280685 [Desarmillaria ectypa]|nr:hypothetical protein DFS33DRAFT_1280685 [Desarmillaria ectypa]